MAKGDIVVSIVIKGGRYTAMDCLGWLGAAGAMANEIQRTDGHTHGNEFHVAFKLPERRKGVMKKFLRTATSHSGVTGSAEQEDAKGKMKSISL